MSEKGKIVEIHFDRNIRYSSIELSKDAWALEATEKTYVPGGEDITIEYTVEDIEADCITSIKDDFDDGNETNIDITYDVMTLQPVGGTPETVGLTSYSTSFDFGDIGGQAFTISNKSMLFESVTCYSETAENVALVIRKYRNTSTWALTNSDIVYTKTVLATANAWTTIIMNTILSAGRYWVGIDVAVGNDLRPNFNAAAPYTGANITIHGLVDENGILFTQYWVHFYSFKFSEPSFPSSGTWTFPIDCNLITDVFKSIIRWTEEKPVGTDVTIYTGVSSSDSTEPTWTEQTFNGRDADSLTVGDNLTGKYLWIKVELETTDEDLSPTVSTPFFKIIEMTDQKAIRLLIAGWGGINRATGDVNVDYDNSKGALAADEAGHRRVAAFNQDFTPTDLSPIDNPATADAIEAAIDGYSVLRPLITWEKGYEKEALDATLSDYDITRTHIDDITP